MGQMHPFRVERVKFFFIFISCTFIIQNKNEKFIKKMVQKYINKITTFLKDRSETSMGSMQLIRIERIKFFFLFISWPFIIQKRALHYMFSEFGYYYEH